MATKPLSDNARAILDFLKANANGVTAPQIVEALDLGGRQVTGLVNGLVRRGLAQRNVIEGQKDKLIILTPEGVGYNPDAE